VAVAHPDIELRRAAGVILQAVEQTAGRDDLDFGITELAVVATLDLATELHRHRLHAVADAEDRHAGIEDLLRRPRRTFFRRRLRATREDDALRAPGRDL